MSSEKQQPLLTVHAHVFHINQETKKSWVPATESAVPVSFFYDSTRAMYRIISVDGTKAVVNSCMRPSMTFTKTSQKFGQWTDPKSNAVYGIGFNTEQDLDKFQEQFDEIKETLHLSMSSPQRLSNNSGGNARLTNGNAVNKGSVDSSASAGNIGSGCPTSTSTDLNANSIYQLRRPLVPGCGLGSPCKIKVDSPKRIQCLDKEEEGRNTPETLLLKQENEKLRNALQQSSANSKLWEIELSNLKANNSRLTTTLQECAANVEEWKSQLESYKRENQRLKLQIQDADNSAAPATTGDKCGDVSSNGGSTLKLFEQVEILRKRSDSLHRQLALKEEEVLKLREELDDNDVKVTLNKTVQMQDERNRLLLQINSRLASKLGEIGGIQQKMTDVLNACQRT